MKDAKRLKEKFENIVDAYLNALLEMWNAMKEPQEEKYTNGYGYWANDDKTGVYCYGDDIFLSLHDVIYCVENNVSDNEVIEWLQYNTEASEFGFTQPNLDSWHRGCPRVPQETFDTLRGYKQRLEDLCEIVKNSPEINIS